MGFYRDNFIADLNLANLPIKRDWSLIFHPQNTHQRKTRVLSLFEGILAKIKDQSKQHQNPI